MMRIYILLLIICSIAVCVSAEEKLYISLETPMAMSEAMELLSDYHEVSYIYEEVVLPESAFHIPFGYRGSIRRPIPLTLTLDPAQDLAGNLEALRQAIQKQVGLWSVQVQGMIIEGIPILVISDADRGGETGSVLSMAKPRRIVGPHAPEEFHKVIARAQKETLEEMGVRLSRYGITVNTDVRPRPGGKLAGEWANPREGVLALIGHIEEVNRVRCAYRFRAVGGNNDGVGYWYVSNLYTRNRRPQYPAMQAGGSFIDRHRDDMDLASAELLAKADGWTFVSRQRSAVLDPDVLLSGKDRERALGGAGGVGFDSAGKAIAYHSRSLRMHVPPNESMAVVLEQALNDDRSIRYSHGPIEILPRNGGGHYLYFGAGKGHTQHSFAQEIPSIQLEAGLTLANAVHMLYQALPETPEQPLTLVPGPWQDHILSEDVELPERPFGSMICDLLSAAGFDPGIIRVHYDLLSESYHFTYTVTESAEE